MNNPRRRLTIQFVLITFLIYITLIGGGLFIFKAELTSSLDEQLDTLLTELTDAIDLEEEKIKLKKTKKIIRKQPLGRLARIELFDEDGRLLEKHGVEGQAVYLSETTEFSDGQRNLRSKSISLSTENDNLVGFLQVQLPTTSRDRALANYGFAMGIMTLFGLGILSLAGYVFSKKAASPLELSYLMLKQFSADAAHELGTPIATISAATDNMRGELDSPAKLEKRITVVERATKRIEKLVDDLMLLTRLGVEVDENLKVAELLNVKSSVADVVNDFEARYEKKEVFLNAEPLEDVQVNGFEDELHRLVVNLLENALRYTDSNGTVTVSVYLESGYAIIRVSDTGIGIPDDSLPHLFDRFYRVDKARSRAVGGNGLGLSIVKAIVDMHNGNISVESKLGEGTTFTVSIPAVS